MLHHHFYFEWLYTKGNYRHIFNIGSGLFIWLFLWITLPFGIYENNLNNLFYVGLFLFPLGLLWTLISYVGDAILPRLIKSYNERKNAYSTMLWALKLVALVHLIFIVRGLLCDWECVDWIEYVQLYVACGLMFLLTYIPFSLYGRYAYFHSLVGVSIRPEMYVSIKGEGKENLKIDPDQIIYVQSDDNYIDLFLADEKQPGRKLIFRCTLKSFADQLKDHPQFFRIHRSIIANIRYLTVDKRPVKSVTMTYQSFTAELPISKSYLADIENLLVHPK